MQSYALLHVNHIEYKHEIHLSRQLCSCKKCNAMQNGFGNARLRSSVCRQGRRLCPREVKQRETLFFDKRKGVSKRILGNTHLSSHETRFFTIRSHKIFADAQIKEIIGNNPSEQFCVEREYLPMANAPPIMQEQM